LIPEIKGYSKDFAPHVVVDPYERVAVLRKGGAIRLRDYLPPNQPIAKKLTFGLAWDITNGRNVDLDASAICLNSSFEPVDIVSYQKLTSADNAIIHGGDEREGDEIGDDEKIHILLDKLNPSIAHICFVVNSYSGQELDDVSSASCHIFDSQTDIDIAKYELTNNRKLDKHTGLLMASLYKDDEGCWCVWIMSEAAQGRVAKQVLPQLQSYLKKNSIPKTQDVPEADIIVNCMPQDVDIAVNLAVPINELAHDILNPTTPGTAYTSNDPFVPQVPAPSKIKNEPQSQGMFVPNIPIY
jgi:stress response protein SCP2